MRTPAEPPYLRGLGIKISGQVPVQTGVFCARGGSPSMSSVSPEPLDSSLRMPAQHFHARYRDRAGQRSEPNCPAGTVIGVVAGAAHWRGPGSRRAKASVPRGLRQR
jgi:hypothetical protein